MKIALLHFSGPPIVGGVEQTLFFHSTGLTELGHEVQLLVGSGEPFDPAIEYRIIPELYSTHPDVLSVKADSDHGTVRQRFETLRGKLVVRLQEVLPLIDVLVVHNALTLHKNLALTAALWDLVQGGDLNNLIGWHHDLAWNRNQYQDELHEGFPWDLLRQAWPAVTNVVVSAAQQEALAELFGVSPDSIYVIPPGIDPEISGGWTTLTQRIVDELVLSQADILLLTPARITRRKNIEFALQILAELVSQTDKDIRLLVTGPPGPHNPSNLTYLEKLVSLRKELGIEHCAHFIYELDPDAPVHLDDRTMASLYRIADAILFPSHQEGFGIPLLEAGLARLPIFCSDIPPFRESAGNLAHFFSLDRPAGEIAAEIADVLLNMPSYLLSRKVRQCCTWDILVKERVEPLLMKSYHA